MYIYIYSGRQNVRRQWFLANKTLNLGAIFMIFVCIYSFYIQKWGTKNMSKISHSCQVPKMT